jgi:hypothetical protein
VGVGVGSTQDRFRTTADPHDTASAFGRVALSPRVSGQLELTRWRSDGGNTTASSATGVLIFDLTTGQALVPTLLVGAGFDESDNKFGKSTARHGEAGVGLEYRATGGLVIGADVRFGRRKVEGEVRHTDVLIEILPGRFQDTAYHSGHLWIGVRL